MNWNQWKEQEAVYACWLCNFPDISNRQIHRLRELCGGWEAVYLANRDKWGETLTSKQVQRLAEYTAGWRPQAEYRRMRESGIELVTMEDGHYPERLKYIPDAPCGLFVRGKLPEGDAPAVAVIGARECSEYGRYIARQLGAALGRGGVTVVSGMARGIDGISQEAAIEAGGHSLGVLGCGVDICYPVQNRALYNRLIKNGAVLSTCPVGSPARPRNFPPRNRIVSGLADAVVVIEARVKSGTLITVDMALEQGREVYVVPGRVTDRLSDGCNRLVKQGANVLLDPESFLEEVRQLWETRRAEVSVPVRQKGRPMTGFKREDCRMDGTAPAEQSSGLGLTMEISEIYRALDFYPKSPETIRENLRGKYTEKQIVTYLMQLCMEDLALQVSPGQFCCKRG